MSKIELQDVQSLTNEQSAINLINNNSQQIELKSDTFLSRDGTAPNTMAASIDMGSNRILNLPEPVSGLEPVRKQDISDATIGELTALKDEAQTSADSADLSEAAAAVSAAAALVSQNAASASQTAAASSETAAAASASNAATSASTASTQATNASNSATAAAGSASSASTSATNASNSASSASTSASNASTSATNAANSATTASTQATNASNSASSASTSATNAGNSATAAATSANQAAASVAAVSFKYNWSTSTSGDPGTGNIAVNNATVGSATALQINETDADGNPIAALIATWGSSVNATGRSKIKIAKNATNFITLDISSAVTDAGTYDTFTITSPVLTGTIANGDTVFVTAAVSGADGSGTGDLSSNTATSVDSEIAVFSGTTGKLVKRATTTGILKGASGVISAATAGTDYMHPGTTSTITVGFGITPYSGGTVSTGTFTPSAANGNYQYYTNNGAHTLAAPSSDCAIDILLTNGASAGVVTFSGFTVNSNTGEPLTTTNTHKFLISIRRINSVATYVIKALQ